MSLRTRAWLSLAILAVVMALVLFGCAGTWRYSQAWVFLAVYFSASGLITVYLLRNDPTLLERRMHGGPQAEKTPVQRLSMAVASVGFVAEIVVPALDRRFGWTRPAPAVVVAADLLIALAFYGVFLVFRENPFAAATVQRWEKQKIIATGPYALVRHPMYAAGALLMLAVPPALGSLWGILGFVVVLPAMLLRLVDEERFLRAGFPEYAEYSRVVRWRLLPGIF